MSVKWVSVKSGGRGGANSMDGLVSVSLNKNGKGENRVCRVGLPVEAMRSMRFVVGDRARIGYDSESKVMLIQRVPVGGNCSLSPQGAGGNKEHKGETMTAQMQFTPDAALLAMLPASLKRCGWSPDTEWLTVRL